MEGFEECHKKFIRLHAEPGSIIISWVFPKGLSGRLEQLARDNAAVFEGQWSGGGDSRREESVPLHSAGGEDQY